MSLGFDHRINFRSKEAQVKSYEGLLLENVKGSDLRLERGGLNFIHILSERKHLNAVQNNAYTFYTLRSRNDIYLSDGTIDTRKSPKSREHSDHIVFKTTTGSISFKNMNVFSNLIRISNFSKIAYRLRATPFLYFLNSYFEAFDITIRGQSIRKEPVQDFLIQQGFTVSHKGKLIVLNGVGKEITFDATVFDLITEKREKTEHKQGDIISHSFSSMRIAPQRGSEMRFLGNYNRYSSHFNQAATFVPYQVPQYFPPFVGTPYSSPAPFYYPYPYMPSSMQFEYYGQQFQNPGIFNSAVGYEEYEEPEIEEPESDILSAPRNFTPSFSASQASLNKKLSDLRLADLPPKAIASGSTSSSSSSSSSSASSMSIRSGRRTRPPRLTIPSS